MLDLRSVLSADVDVLGSLRRQIKLLVFDSLLPSLSCVNLFYFILGLYLIKVVCIIDLIEDKRKEFCAVRNQHTFLDCTVVQVIICLEIEFDFYQLLFQVGVKHENWFLFTFHF